jgi:hypothetical protein
MPLGLYAADGSLRVTQAGTEQAAGSEVTIDTADTMIGTRTEAAPGTDTAESGLNGRLQRIAQRLTTLIGLLDDAAAGEYETVAASQTDQVLGATGAAGDFLACVWIVPATLSPGNVLIQDGAGSDITIFTGGASSVSNLVAFPFAVNAYSVSGAWKVTTGANVSCFCTGNFT